MLFANIIARNKLKKFKEKKKVVEYFCLCFVNFGIKDYVVVVDYSVLVVNE